MSIRVAARLAATLGITTGPAHRHLRSSSKGRSFWTSDYPSRDEGDELPAEERQRVATKLSLHGLRLRIAEDNLASNRGLQEELFATSVDEGTIDTRFWGATLNHQQDREIRPAGKSDTGA